MNEQLVALSRALGRAGIAIDPSGAAWLLAGTLALVALVILGWRLRDRVNLKVWYGGLALVAPLILFLGLGFQHDPHEIDSPLIGKKAPDFTLSPIDGGAPVKLSEQRGMPTVVNFWATWCVPCQQEHRTLVAVAKRLDGKARFFGVVYQDEPAKIQEWLTRAGTFYPQLLDVGSQAAIAFGVYGVPETYVIDPGGTITYKFTGPVDAQSLLAQLAPLMGS